MQGERERVKRCSRPPLVQFMHTQIFMSQGETEAGHARCYNLGSGKVWS